VEEAGVAVSATAIVSRTAGESEHDLEHISHDQVIECDGFCREGGLKAIAPKSPERLEEHLAEGRRWRGER
jgi:hypothetical protein